MKNPLLLSLLLIGLTSQAQFQQQTLPLILPNVNHFSVADYNADGYPDFFIQGIDFSAMEYYTRIYSYNPGAYSEVAINLPDFEKGSGIWGDYNGDLLVDFYCSGELYTSSYEQALYQNAGAGSLLIQTGMPMPLLEASYWLDIDNDGDLDLCHGGIYFENDQGEFVLLPDYTYTTGNYLYADFNEDSYADLIAYNGINYGTPMAELYLNQKNGLFQKVINSGIVPMKGAAADIGDMDSDGDIDLVMMGDTSDGNNQPFMYVYENIGGSLIKHLIDLPAMTSGILKVADLNHDGRPDILFSKLAGLYTDSIIVAYNAGNFMFPNTQFIGIKEKDGLAAWMDVNQDGALDLFVTNEYNSCMQFLNQGSNLPPNPPASIDATIAGSTLSFTWSAGSDDTSPDSSLFYNLDMYSLANQSHVKSPEADSITGRKYKIDHGNAGINRFFHMNINQIPPGVYQARVQAIDQSLQAGPFTDYISLLVYHTSDFEVSLSQTGANEVIVVSYTGNAPDSAVFNWNFDGATILSGSGPGPYEIAFNNQGAKTISLQVDYNGLSSYISTQNIFIGGSFESIQPNIAIKTGKHLWFHADDDPYRDLLAFGFDSAGNYSGELYKNQGNGQFSLLPSNLSNYPLLNAVLYDWNGDGRTDILASLRNNVPGIVILLQGANFQFMPVEHNLPEYSGMDLSLADVNNDGDMDILLTGFLNNNYRMRLAINEGNQSFSLHPELFTNLSLQPDCWSDFDLDGDLDFLSGRTIMVNHSDAETFEELELPLFNPGSGSHYDHVTHWIDANSDGWDDVLVLGFYGAYRCILYVNDGNGGFNPQEATPLISSSLDHLLRTGDFDNDGADDLLMTNHTSLWVDLRPLILYARQGFQFESAGIEFTQGTYYPMLNDFDSDGDLDFSLSGYYADRPFEIFRNQTSIENQAPFPPGEIETWSSDSGYIFGNWSAGSDLETSDSSLYYNVHLYREGGDTLLAANARVPQGDLHFFHRGNRVYARHFYLKVPEPGTYHWAVQSIDKSYQASPFSEFQTVQVLNISESTKPTSVDVFPNPVSEKLHIAWSAPNPVPVRLTIFSLTGRIIHEQLLSFSAEGSMELDVSSYPEGIYFYRLESANLSEGGRFIRLNTK